MRSQTAQIAAAILLAATALPALAEPGAESRSGYQRGQSRARQLPAARIARADDAQEKPSAGKPRSAMRLAPRDTGKSRTATSSSFPTSQGAVGSVLGSLAAVLGVFLLIVWCSKRMAPAGTKPLPKEAVELLGRTSISGQHALQLLRVGGRLLLVSLSPQGARTLTEITDPDEVQRLTALCLRQGAAASFQETLAQLEREPGGSSQPQQRRGSATRGSSRV